VLDKIGKGIIRTISISKTIKMIPRRKNRNENGIRAVFLGSNPHSKGDVFSRSDSERDLRNQAATKVTKAKIAATEKADVNKFINWKYYYYLLIKSQVLLASSPVRHRGTTHI
jgi:hypothetical protein